MKWRIVPVWHQLGACVALNVNLRWCAFKSISFMQTLSALFSWAFIIIRGREIRSSSHEPSSSWFSHTPGWRWINYSLSFGRNYFFSMNLFWDINWVMPKNIFLSCFLFLLIASFFFRMRFKIILNDAVKNRISNSSCNIFPTCNTLLFFCNY